MKNFPRGRVRVTFASQQNREKRYIDFFEIRHFHSLTLSHYTPVTVYSNKLCISIASVSLKIYYCPERNWKQCLCKV